jgi:hypothetical protein
VGVRGARAERRHRAPPSQRRRLGSVPSVVPTEDADAGDVRVCYPATATCPEPRQGPAGRDVPVRRDQTADTTVSYDTANILHSYDFSL